MLGFLLFRDGGAGGRGGVVVVAEGSVSFPVFIRDLEAFFVAIALVADALVVRVADALVVVLGVFVIVDAAVEFDSFVVAVRGSL